MRSILAETVQQCRVRAPRFALIITVVAAASLAACASPGAGTAGSPNVPSRTILPSPSSPTDSPTPSLVATPSATGGTESASPPDAVSTAGAGAFTLLRMASSADPSRPAPDATNFTSTFAAKAPALFVVFALRPALIGRVDCTITVNGVVVVRPLAIDYGPTNSWGDFRITSRGIFAVGDYQATLTYEPTGEVATVDFTVR